MYYLWSIIIINGWHQLPFQLKWIFLHKFKFFIFHAPLTHTLMQYAHCTHTLAYVPIRFRTHEYAYRSLVYMLWPTHEYQSCGYDGAYMFKCCIYQNYYVRCGWYVKPYKLNLFSCKTSIHFSIGSLTQHGWIWWTSIFSICSIKWNWYYRALSLRRVLIAGTIFQRVSWWSRRRWWQNDSTRFQSFYVYRIVTLTSGFLATWFFFSFLFRIFLMRSWRNVLIHRVQIHTNRTQ